MGRYGDIDYSRLAKGGFGAGVALFLVGLAGLTVVPTFVGELPAWEHALLLDAEFLGVAVAFFSPLVFGIALPLTE